jgi:hypothetical protein
MEGDCLNCVGICSVRNKIWVEKRLKFRQRAVRHATEVTVFNNIAYLTARRLCGKWLFSTNILSLRDLFTDR